MKVPCVCSVVHVRVYLLHCAVHCLLRHAFILSFHFISFHFISFHFISFHFISFHFISFHFISFHFISFHFISFHFISFHFISFHFISFHFISFHFISFHFISFHSFHASFVVSQGGYMCGSAKRMCHAGVSAARSQCASAVVHVATLFLFARGDKCASESLG